MLAGRAPKSWPASQITHRANSLTDSLPKTASGFAPPRGLHRVFVNFPDPWPKKRHHKRRILQPAFLQLCAERLAGGGSLHIATDWANYAEHIDALMAAAPEFACAERREHDGDAPLDRPVTKFERRGLGKGHRIWDWRFDRTA